MQFNEFRGISHAPVPSRTSYPAHCAGDALGVRAAKPQWGLGTAWRESSGCPIKVLGHDGLAVTIPQDIRECTSQLHLVVQRPAFLVKNAADDLDQRRRFFDNVCGAYADTRLSQPGRLLDGHAVDYRREVGPDGQRGTHGAWLARGEENRAAQVILTQGLHGLPHGVHFGM